MKLFSFIFAAAILALVAFFVVISLPYPGLTLKMPWALSMKTPLKSRKA